MRQWLILIATCLCLIAQNAIASTSLAVSTIPPGRWQVSLDELQRSHKPLKIGIITGVTWEAQELLKQFEVGYSSTRQSGRDYHHGLMWGIDTVLVSSRCGKVAAAITATTLIIEHDVDFIIVTGTAGAVSEQLHIGDVVVASSLIQHDMDSRPITPRYLIPILRIGELEPNIALQKLALQATHHFVTEQIKDMPASDIAEFQLDCPAVYSGLIASGDQFLADRNRRAEIGFDLPNLRCVDMESAAVGQVCYEFGVPLVVVRILSDNADENAAVDCFRFMKMVAPVYSSQIIRSMYQYLSKDRSEANL